MATLRNLARVRSATVGAGTLTLGAAVTGFLTFAQAGVLDGETVSYGIFDHDGAGNHTASESGRGVYNAGAGTLTRNVLDSTNGGAPLVLSGNEHVFVTILKQDMDHASGSIANVGTNTHAQIDSHIANVANPHSVTAAQVGAQPLDATLTSIALLGTAANRMIYTTGVDTWAETTITAFGRSILDDADEATFKATVNLEIGVDVQAYDSTLAGIAALADAAGALTNDGAGNLSWAASAGSLPVVDTTAIVKGSADATKLMRFEIDGYTTGTTRVLTPPNADITLAGQNYANEFTVTQKIYTSAGGASTIALSLHTNTVGGLPAYGIGMGDTNVEGYVEYRSGTASSNTFGHRFLVNTVNALAIGGTDIRLNKPTLINLSSTTAFYADSLFYVDTANARVGVGAAPLYQFDITSNTASGRGLTVSQHSSNNNGAPMAFVKSRGTKTSQSAIANGDFVGAFTFNGYSGTQYLVDNAYFGGVVSGAVSASSVPTSIVFVAGAAASNYTPDLLIYHTHRIGIGAIGGTIITSLTEPSALLHVKGRADEIQEIIQGYSTQTANLTEWRNSSDAVMLNVQPDGDLEFHANNIITDTTTGTKIGTGTTQKLGLWNATPIVQPSGAAQAALTNSTGGGNDGTLVDVTTLGVADPVKINDNFTDVYTLLNAMRTAMVNFGSMKGAA